jgi:hypothetical protein
MNLHVHLHLAQILDDVVGKRIVIIDDQDHGFTIPESSKPSRR